MDFLTHISQRCQIAQLVVFPCCKRIYLDFHFLEGLVLEELALESFGLLLPTSLTALLAFLVPSSFFNTIAKISDCTLGPEGLALESFGLLLPTSLTALLASPGAKQQGRTHLNMPGHRSAKLQEGVYVTIMHAFFACWSWGARGRTHLNVPGHSLPVFERSQAPKTTLALCPAFRGCGSAKLNVYVRILCLLVVGRACRGGRILICLATEVQSCKKV